MAYKGVSPCNVNHRISLQSLFHTCTATLKFSREAVSMNANVWILQLKQNLQVYRRNSHKIQFKPATKWAPKVNYNTEVKSAAPATKHNFPFLVTIITIFAFNGHIFQICDKTKAACHVVMLWCTVSGHLLSWSPQTVFLFTSIYSEMNTHYTNQPKHYNHPPDAGGSSFFLPKKLWPVVEMLWPSGRAIAIWGQTV